MTISDELLPGNLKDEVREDAEKALKAAFPQGSSTATEPVPAPDQQQEK
jgi:hypothetical protein